MEIIENVISKNMWPTTTYTFTVNNIDNEQIKNKCLERENKGLGFRFDPVQGGGWQSNKDLLEEPSSVFVNLKKSLLFSANTILSPVYRDDAEIKMIGSWANISMKGEYTMPHIHEGASWSCVYYVTPTGDANLYFKDPRTNEHMDSSHFFTKLPYANMIRKRPFEAGEAILFPSWLEHGVGPSTENDARISIACNLLIEG